MPAPAERDRALVLRSVDFGEADRIVTLLTERHGKLAALARAARKSKRRFAGALEGFALLEVELSKGRGELWTLQAARVVRPFPALLRDLTRLEAAGALLRLARELIPEHVPDPEPFDALCAMLEALEHPEVPAEPYQLAAEARLLSLAGFAPRLTACGICNKHPAANQSAEFDPLRGSLVCQACGGANLKLSSQVRERLIQAMEGALQEAAQANWTREQLTQANKAITLFTAHRLQKQPRRTHDT